MDRREPSNGIATVVTARPMSLGGIHVARVLPTLQRRTVGPFVFLDHMGPATIPPGHGFDVPPHPHVGLATVTWLFEGEAVHRDSLSVVQPIRPGEVNLMIAGRGVTHSERSSEASRAHGGRLHGLQFWLGLPLALEDCEPSFQHAGVDVLPDVGLGAASALVVLGEALGVRSPVKTPSETLFVELHFGDSEEVALPLAAERALYVAEGEVLVRDARFGAGTLLVLEDGADVSVRTSGPALAALFGGTPLDGGRRLMDWNFVSSSREVLERAKADWKAQRFPKIPGDDRELVPLPEPRRREGPA